MNVSLTRVCMCMSCTHGCRPRIYRNAADHSKMTGLPAHTKMTGALVSPEMQAFVQKDMPQVRQYRTDPRPRALSAEINRLVECVCSLAPVCRVPRGAVRLLPWQLHRRPGQLTASLVCLPTG